MKVLSIQVLCLALAFTPLASLAMDKASASRVSTETRTPGEFSAIAVEGSIGVVVNQGATRSLQIQADADTLPLIETVVESGRHGATLQIRFKRGTSRTQRGSVDVKVTTPELLALAVAGSGNVRIESFTTPSLKLSLAGSSNATLAGLSTADLGVSLAGSSDLRGDGRANRLTISVAGSGDVRLADLQSDEVAIKVAGSGDVAVNAQRTLKVSIAGSGDVRYVGDPAVQSSVAGSGSIRKR